MTLRRILIAAAMAPSIPAILILAINLTSGSTALLQATVLVSLMVSYAGSFLLGTPYALLLRKKERLDFCHLVPGGFVLGALAFWVFIGVLAPADDLSGTLLRLVPGAISGAVVATVFAMIAGVPFMSSRPSHR